VLSSAIPDDGAPWGFRVEGHHLSLNLTLGAGPAEPSRPPSWDDPARVPSGPLEGHRVLGSQEDLAASWSGLPAATGAGDHRRAIAWQHRDRSGRADGPQEPRGAPMGEMGPATARTAERLIEESSGTSDRARRGAAPRASASRARRDPLRLGRPLEPGHAHYFRLHGPRLLIEHDNHAERRESRPLRLAGSTRDFASTSSGEHYRSGHHAQTAP